MSDEDPNEVFMDSSLDCADLKYNGYSSKDIRSVKERTNAKVQQDVNNAHDFTGNVSSMCYHANGKDSTYDLETQCANGCDVQTSGRNGMFVCDSGRVGVNGRNPAYSDDRIYNAHERYRYGALNGYDSELIYHYRNNIDRLCVYKNMPLGKRSATHFSTCNPYREGRKDIGVCGSDNNSQNVNDDNFNYFRNRGNCDYGYHTRMGSENGVPPSDYVNRYGFVNADAGGKGYVSSVDDVPVEAYIRSDYTCGKCNRVFARISSLKLHIMFHIQHADIFICPLLQCKKTYKGQSMLIGHINEAHMSASKRLVKTVYEGKWASDFRCFLAMNDFYSLIGKDDENPFRDAFCFECFTFPLLLSHHPCPRKYSSITYCPGCNVVVSQGGLKRHVFDGSCKRRPPVLK